MNSETLFVLIAPQELKDDLVDLLISMDSLSGFNLKTINGYSKEHSHFNIAEQVEGYRELIQFEVLLPEKDKKSFLAQLAPLCRPAKLRYWFLPVSDDGHF